MLSSLFLVSGMSALLYQVVWTKKLALLFGVTTYAVSTTLSVFMLGLALGSWYFGALADRTKNPLKCYAFLEGGIAVSAALSLGLLELTDLVIAHLGFSSSSSLSFTICRVAGSFLVLIVPTFLMGGTAPVLAKVLVTSSQSAGKKLGVLYAANTLGGVAGCLLAGFAIIPAIGLSGALLCGVLGNLAVALVAWFFLAQDKQVPQDAAGSEQVPAAAAAQSAIQQIEGMPAAMLVAFFVAGFLGLAAEVAWTRLLLLYLDCAAQTFAGMLAVYLLGLALGSAVSGRLADRYDAARGFALCQILTGAVILAGIVFYLPHWLASSDNAARWTVAHLPGLQENNSAEKIALCLMLSLTLIFLPTFLMGCAFPFAGRFFAGEAATLGKRLGSAYMWNTAGCMLGPLFAGFWWLPHFGIQNTLIICSLGYAACGMAVLVVRNLPARRLQWSLAGIAGIAGLAIVLSMLPDHALAYITQRKNTTVVHYEEDQTGSVFVIDRNLGREKLRQLLVGSTSMISNTFRCRRYTRLIGGLPMLMHPAPRKALVICLGSGMTLSAVASHPDVESIDCADLSEGVIYSARNFFTDENAHVLDDPRVHVIVNDGRTHLIATQERYDVIALEPPPPNNAGVSNLYSQEFYQLCKSRLNKGGMVAQWVPYHCITLEQSRSMVGTMQSVFPATTFWELFGGDEYCVIGHADDTPVPYDRLAKRLAVPSVGAPLAAVGIRGAEDLLACFVMGPKQSRNFSAQAPLITDDLPGLGYDLSAFALVAANSTPSQNERFQSELQAAILATSTYSEDPSGFFKFENDAAKAAFAQRVLMTRGAWMMHGRAIALTMTEKLSTGLFIELGRGFQAPILLDPGSAYFQNAQKNGLYTKALRRLAAFFEQSGETEQARRFADQLKRLEELSSAVQ